MAQSDGKRGVLLRIKIGTFDVYKGQEFLLGACQWQPSGVWAPCSPGGGCSTSPPICWKRIRSGSSR